MAKREGKECAFEDTSDDRTLEHLIQTVDNDTLIKKAINKHFSLEQFLMEATQMQDITQQMKEVKPPSKSVAKVGATQHAQKNRNQSYRPPTRRQDKRYDGRIRDETKHKTFCEYCGLTGVHTKGQNCPVRFVRDAIEETTLLQYAEIPCRRLINIQEIRRKRKPTLRRPRNRNRSLQVLMMNIFITPWTTSPRPNS